MDVKVAPAAKPEAREAGLSEAGLSEAIARAAAAYDELPYVSNPFAQTHPARIAAIAHVLGLEAPRVETARVLEIGCSSAGNIIPMAARLPMARFTGIDISQAQIDLGKARIGRLGLANIKLQCKSVTEISAADGVFDYIICHGVYSWVPEPVRDAILDVCRTRLSPNGAAYVSYNVLPGWRMLQAVRDALQLASPRQTPLRQRVAKGREILDFLARLTRDGTVWGNVFRNEAPRLARLPEDYIGHEFLEEVNEPCSFGEFFEKAAARGLAYAGEADIASMLPENLGPEAGAGIRRACGNDLRSVESHMDAVSGRTFRQSLLVHGDRASRIDRNLNFERLRGLHFSCGPDLHLKPDQSAGFVFSDAAGRTLTTSSLNTCEAIKKLMERRPGTSSLDEMIDPRSGKETRDTVLDALFKMMMTGLAGIQSHPARAALEVAVKPLACPLAMSDAAAGASFAANLRHERIELGIVPLRILPLLDGAHDCEMLEAAVIKSAGAGDIVFLRQGERIHGAEAIADCAREHVQVALDQLRLSALLVPGSAAIRQPKPQHTGTKRL